MSTTGSSTGKTTRASTAKAKGRGSKGAAGADSGAGKADATRAGDNLSGEELHRFYHDMLLIRRFEETAGQLYGRGLSGGFCHLYIGQEAVVVGLEAVAEEGDKRITAYRDHGHMLACGRDPNGVMAELT
ncbi:MAG: hypothetical protein JJU40_01015, partial [Rhodobacteraceae bacterium]|nr:hypothetical protein [Paracoccaceae bacterium]